MKTITTIAMGIILLSCISAIELKAGECSTIEFPNSNSVQVQFSGNSSDMNGFEWNKSGTLITYCFPLNYNPDNITITWFNSEEISVSSDNAQGGEGSVARKNPIENNSNLGVPEAVEGGEEECSGDSCPAQEAEEQASFFSTITGAVIGTRTGKLISVTFIILFLLGVIVYFGFVRKK